MKHILNNLTEEEKNAIREQHTGGMKVMTENFSKLTNSKLGDSKPLVSEMDDDFGKFDVKGNASQMYEMNRRKLEQAIQLLADSAKKGEDTSHYEMIIKMTLREMDSYVQDLMK
jgi:hypothetical protein